MKRPSGTDFMKPDSAVLLKQHPFVIPEFSDDVHHEIEYRQNKRVESIEPKFRSLKIYYDRDRA
jgi:hypothetical protein